MRTAVDAAWARRALWVGVLAATGLCGVSCRSHPKTADQRDTMREDIADKTSAILARLYSLKPGSREGVEKAPGYAVFTDFGARLLVVGTARGKGVAVHNSTGSETFMRMTEVSAGLGPSIKKFDLVFVFTSEQSFRDFVNKGWQFQAGAEAAAKAGKTGGALEGAFALGDDVYVFQLTEAGLALELSLKGAKFYRDKGID